MSGSVNKVLLLGHLGADPDIRTTNAGGRLATFSVATSESWRDKTTGERREKTEWHRVVVFSEGLVNLAENYLKKGSKVWIEGQLSTRKWEDQAGQTRYSTEVVLQGFNAGLTMLDSKGTGYRAGGDGPEDHGLDGDRAAGPGKSGTQESPTALDDEIPF